MPKHPRSWIDIHETKFNLDGDLNSIFLFSMATVIYMVFVFIPHTVDVKNQQLLFILYVRNIERNFKINTCLH